MATTTISSSGVLGFNDNTGAVQLPSGTTAERPVSASNGQIRYNTTDNKVEYYDGTSWQQYDDYNSAAYDIDYLVIAGGGNGGTNAGQSLGSGGGGGAGGLRTTYGTTSGGGCALESKPTFTLGTTYTFTIGGAENDSSMTGSDITTITSTAGGRGGEIGSNGNGGSGGGASQGGGFPATPAGTGTSCQGFNGGTTSVDSGAGGGGSGAVGANTTSLPSPGDGGAGVGVPITGSYVFYAAGGGAGLRLTSSSTTGTPGSGGLGDGSGDGGRRELPPNYTGTNGTAGKVNSGGGGGGGGTAQNSGHSNGGAGGSGVIIVRMPTANYSGTTTGSPTVTTVGSDTVLTYTGSGTYTA